MITKEQIIDQLKTVYDPELGINIVDLGLIYEVQISDEGDVQIMMTLTTPGCPLHDSISTGARTSIELLPGVRTVNVDLVWEPAWNPEMMSDDAKRQLGRF